MPTFKTISQLWSEMTFIRHFYSIRKKGLNLFPHLELSHTTLIFGGFPRSCIILQCLPWLLKIQVFGVFNQGKQRKNDVFGCFPFFGKSVTIKMYFFGQSHWAGTSDSTASGYLWSQWGYLCQWRMHPKVISTWIVHFKPWNGLTMRVLDNGNGHYARGDVAPPWLSKF